MHGAHFFINIIFDIHTYVLFMLMYVKTRTHTNTQFSFNVAVKLLDRYMYKHKISVT